MICWFFMTMFCCILRVKDYMMAEGPQIGGGLFLKRPFAQWHHFATDTRMLQCLAFLCKIIRTFVVLNLAGIAKFKCERKNENKNGFW